MRDFLTAFVLGLCTLATAYAMERAVAPFYGQGAFLLTTTLVVAFLAIAAGLALGALRAASQRHGTTAVPLLAAIGWTLLAAWLRTPLLQVLGAAGLRLATVIAVVAFIGVPVSGIASTLAYSTGQTSASRPGGSAWYAIASALSGAAIGVPLVIWLLLPGLGISGTLILTAGVEGLVGCVILGGTGSAVAQSAAAVLVVLVSVFCADGSRHDSRRGVIEAREGAAAQYRVVEREDGRFLIADGGIQTMLSKDTGEPLWRPAAALRIVDLFFAHPDSMVVLGLRGGAVAKYFAREGWQVTAVEPDPDALGIASRSLSFSAREIPTRIDDLRQFVRTDSGRHPVVILDAFGASPFPRHLVTREFFAEVSRRVATNGLFATVVVARGWDDPLIASLATELRERFRSVVALPTSEPPNTVGSIVLLASNRTLELPEERLPQPTDYLMNPEGLWGVTQMNHAWLNRFTPPAGREEFTDDRSGIDRISDGILYASRLDAHQTFAAGGLW